MPKLLTAKSPPSPACYSQLQDRINAFLSDNRNKSLSLFEKLQFYDQVIGDLGLGRTEERVLGVFRDLVYGAGRQEDGAEDGQGTGIEMMEDKGKTRKKVIQVFSSPTHNKKQPSIEDPQLFSFSKTRKDSSNSHRDPALTVLSRQNLQKIKQNSDKPRYTAPVMTEPNERKVSQFNSEYEESKSVYQLGKIVRDRIAGKNMRVFVAICRRDIKQRRRNFKLKTSQYIHELKLMQKTVQSLKKSTLTTKQLVEEHQQAWNAHKLGQIFGQWYRYATRSEEQRYREKQVKVKQQYLMMVLGVKQFLKNSRVGNEEGEVSWNARQLQIKEDITGKSQILRKYLALKCMKGRYESNQQLKRKANSLESQLKRKYSGLLVKMIRCYAETWRIKEEKMVNKAVAKINSIRLVRQLKKEYHFQKAYWADNPHQIQKGEPYLNGKYKKIMLLYQIFDCMSHSLTRKGYTLHSQPMTQIHSHIAYKAYYKPSKLHRYFTALKQTLLTETQQKINTVKFQIVGCRVLDGLLSQYRERLAKQVREEEIKENLQQFEFYLGEKRKVEFLRLFEKEGGFSGKIDLIGQHLKHSRVVHTLMTMKTYTFSKTYYRKVILQSKLKKKLKLLQGHFLQWKLLYIENVHNRLLEKDLEQIRKKYAIRALKQNIDLYSIDDRIQRKKEKNLRRALLQNYGEGFLGELRREWQVKVRDQKRSDPEFKKSCLALTQMLTDRKKEKFLAELMQYWYQCRLASEIQAQILQQYQKKLLIKSMLGLKQMKKVQDSHRELALKIRTKKEQKGKKQILSLFIQATIKKLTLRRMATISKVYWFRKFKNNVIQEQE